MLASTSTHGERAADDRLRASGRARHLTQPPLSGEASAEQPGMAISRSSCALLYLPSRAERA